MGRHATARAASVALAVAAIAAAGCGATGPASGRDRAPAGYDGARSATLGDRPAAGPAAARRSSTPDRRGRRAAVRRARVRPAVALRRLHGIALLAADMGPRLIAGEPVGRSARGRPIVVTASGDPAARRRVLVVGCIHGTECARMAVARRVQRGPAGCPPATADIWALANLDPDGLAAGSRLNGHGVDLNRNFRAAWRPIGRPWDLEYSGPRPFSEPETRVARAIVRAFRPDTTIWFHQQTEPLVRAWGQSVPAARRYARLAGMRFRRMPWPAGTAPHWQNTRFPRTASFVVELAPGPLSPAAARRHARAVMALAGVRLAPGVGGE